MTGGSALEIDWPLTLAWWVLGAAIISAFFAWRATHYSKLSYRLQHRQHEAAPTGIEVSDTELFLLRLIEEHGPLKRGEYREPSSMVSSWCSDLTLKCVRGRTYAPGNHWFLSTLEWLEG